METIKQANKIIKAGIMLLPDDAKKEYKSKLGDLFVYEAINNACGMVNGDAEKEALLGAWAVQEANRVVGELWRLQLLSDKLEEEYRSLPTMKEMADAYNKFTDSRRERMDKIVEEHKIIAEEEKKLDIFKGVINGMSKEKAEKDYAAYEAQQRQALGR